VPLRIATARAVTPQRTRKMRLTMGGCAVGGSTRVERVRTRGSTTVGTLSLVLACSFAIGTQAPVGQFNYPRNIAIAPDGTVYVADTANHRVQRFSADGALLTKWSSLGTGDVEGEACPAGRAV